MAYFGVGVKLWAQFAPNIEEVRPQVCPCCGASGARSGGRLGLVGHGTRERQVLGPCTAEGRPEVIVLRLRRYRCRHCGAIVTSAPAGLLRRVLYGAVAVALALGLWAHGQQPGVLVRARVSPLRSGAERWHGWRSLRRWARSAARLWPGLQVTPTGAREQAASVVSQLAARAAEASGAVVALACCGALMHVTAQNGWVVDPPELSVEVSSNSHRG